MRESVIKALKETGRVVVLAIIPIGVHMLESWTFDWKLLVVVAGVALLRGVDKFLHLESPEGVAGGLVRF